MPRSRTPLPSTCVQSIKLCNQLCNQHVQSTLQSTCAINLSTYAINLCNQMCPGDGHFSHQHVPRRRSFLKDRSGGKLLPNKQVILQFALFPLQYFCPAQQTPNCPAFIIAHSCNQSWNGLNAGLTTFLNLLQFAVTRWEKIFSNFTRSFIWSYLFSFLFLILAYFWSFIWSHFSQIFLNFADLCAGHTIQPSHFYFPHIWDNFNFEKCPFFSSSRRIS